MSFLREMERDVNPCKYSYPVDCFLSQNTGFTEPHIEGKPSTFLPRAFAISHIKSRIHKVYVLLIELFAQQLDSFTKTLEVHDLPLPKEFDYIIHIRVIRQPQNVVVGYACFLLRRQVFHQICHGVALDLEHTGIVDTAGCWIGEYPCGMVHEVWRKGRILNLMIL